MKNLPFKFLLCLLLSACGAAGGGGGSAGGGAAGASDPQVAAALQKIWLMQNVNAPSCLGGIGTIGAEFRADGTFGLIFYCNQSPSRYEAIYGTYSAQQGSLRLVAEADQCSTRTTYWDQFLPDGTATFAIELSANTLKFPTLNAEFAPTTTQDRDNFLLASTRSCYVNSGLGSFTWENYNQTSTFTNTSTSTSTSTSVVVDPPLSFEFTLNGSQTAITPAFSTDNVLKVRFVPGSTQGNNFHSASELSVTLTVNNTEFTPKYSSNNYTYGTINEQSNIIDMSSYITPGNNVQIAIKNPKSDFYCTYAPNPFYYWDGTQWAPINPLYNSYPGCRKAVFSNHQWSGKVLVQTSSTSAL